MAAPLTLLSDEQARLVFEMWEQGRSRQEIAAAVNRSVSSIFDRSRARRGLGASGRGSKGLLSHPSFEHLPDRRGRGGGRRPGAAHKAGAHVTESESETRRREIFESWSDEERASRWNAGPIDGDGRPRELGQSATESPRGDTPPGHHTWASEPVRGTVSARIPHRRNW